MQDIHYGHCVFSSFQQPDPLRDTEEDDDDEISDLFLTEKKAVFLQGCEGTDGDWVSLDPQWKKDEMSLLSQNILCIHNGCIQWSFPGKRKVFKQI